MPLSSDESNLVKYATAKIVILGDPGVGKSRLGRELARSSPTETTKQGQNFWIVKDFSTKLEDDTECEVVLWDLIGKPAYQSIHPIFLDDVDVALVLFDPTNRRNTINGVEFWLEQLCNGQKLPPCILVGTRIERGVLIMSQEEMNNFCKTRGVSGGYIGVSAETGEGLDELREKIKSQISWKSVRDKSTIIAFNLIKKKVLELKKASELPHAAVRTSELKKFNENLCLSEEDVLASARHLRKHGYVEILSSSSGETFILFKPELLMEVSSSIVALADSHPRGLGAFSETQLLQGVFQFPELSRIAEEQQKLLIESAITRLIDHHICFRERYGVDDLLIFPSLIRQKRPSITDSVFDDVSYIATGNVKDIYPALVVLLGYTNSFKRFNLWQNQVQYEYEDKEYQVCGFKLDQEQAEEIELVLYYGDRMPEKGRRSFQELFELFISQREVQVQRFPPVVCPEGHLQARTSMIKRSIEEKYYAFCNECGKRFEIPKIEALEKPQKIGLETAPWLQHEKYAVELRSSYEKYLVRVKGYWEQDVKPRCYLSHITENKRWTEKLAYDLGLAGVEVIEKLSNIGRGDYLITLNTAAYKRAWDKAEKPLEQDIKIIKTRLQLGKSNIISIVLEGGSNLPHDFSECNPADFCDETHYHVSLLNLVLVLYSIPLNHTGFVPLRQSLHEQWERNFVGKSHKIKKPLKVFISYSRKDEEFKDELVTMLAGLQRRGVIDPWQDRRIEEGDEWYQEIQEAMKDCDLAILLISGDFIASRFIQDVELPKLFERRMVEGLRVVPVIVRSCLWKSEPTLGRIQALPLDGKPVITFQKNSGERDRIWTDIAEAIEQRAKSFGSRTAEYSK